jgi:hypothetical protein
MVSFHLLQQFDGVDFVLIVNHFVMHAAQKDKVFWLLNLICGKSSIVSRTISFFRNDVTFLSNDRFGVSGSPFNDQFESANCAAIS